MTNTHRPFNSWDGLKIIALLFMSVDHLGAYFLVHEQWLRAIGRGSAPIFLFLAGYASSYRFRREIFALACLMSISNIFMGEYTHPLNILFTILIWRGVLDGLESRGNVVEKPLEWFIVAIVFILPTYLLFQYGTLGLMFALCGYMQRRPERYAPATQHWFMIASLVAYAATLTLFFDLSLFSILLMVPVLYLNYRLLTRFTIHSLDMSQYPHWLVRILTLSSHYSGYIYAIHLIIISWISGYGI